MSVWKFQLLPSRKDAFGTGFRMDAVGQAFETEVNDALRYPFKFRKVNKLVLELGPGSPPKKDYRELLGVAIKQCPEFDLDLYISLPEIDKIDSLKIQTIQAFEWLRATFPDAQFVDVGLQNLGWRRDLIQ